MKKVIASILIIVSLFIITGCSYKENDNNSNEEIKSVKAIINDKEYIINLEDNATAKSFVEMIPKEYTMS
jgi:hypothetical protein